MPAKSITGKELLKILEELGDTSSQTEYKDLKMVPKFLKTPLKNIDAKIVQLDIDVTKTTLDIIITVSKFDLFNGTRTAAANLKSLVDSGLVGFTQEKKNTPPTLTFQRIIK